MGKKTNPRNKPASEEDVKRARAKGIEDGVTCACAIFLTVMVDKFDAEDKIKDIWGETNKLSEEIKEGRVSVADLRYTLRSEYGIEL